MAGAHFGMLGFVNGRDRKHRAENGKPTGLGLKMIGEIASQNLIAGWNMEIAKMKMCFGFVKAGEDTGAAMIEIANFGLAMAGANKEIANLDMAPRSQNLIANFDFGQIDFAPKNFAPADIARQAFLFCQKLAYSEGC